MTTWLRMLLLCGAGAAFGQTLPPSSFPQTLYPMLREKQCQACHHDNGVASGTRLRFPAENAPATEVARFGMALAALVDRERPEESLLLKKPTNRVAHTGGERIQPGSDEERALRRWVEYLAKAPVESPQAAPQTAVREPIRRLTHQQYNNTVRDLLGDQSRPADQFPKEDVVHGFTNQADGQSISPLLAEAYNRAAERLARDAFRGGDARGLLPCKPRDANDAACRERFVRVFGRRAFRRPLTAAEAQRYAGLHAKEAARTGEFLKGSQIVVEAMLQSPHFLLHLARGPQGTASRLSYFLWNTMPDERLLADAEAGRLNTPAQVRAAAERMLQDGRARVAVNEFLAQWLRFDRLRAAVRDPRLFPTFNAELVGDMAEETRRLFEYLVWEDRDFREFFAADYTFLSAGLSRLYDLPAPAEHFGRVTLPAKTGRAGVLGQGSFLTLTSKPADTSPTERGLFVREHFLCQIVPPPPPGVDTTLPPVMDEKPMTVRQRLGVHLSSPVCAGCHRLIDPIGFGLERFDAVGSYREAERLVIPPTADEIKRKVKTQPTEYRLAIDPAGLLQGIPSGKFESPRELGKLLADSETCHRCVAKQVFRYATGRLETEADQETVASLVEQFRASQFRFRELIMAVATSRTFLGGTE